MPSIKSSVRAVTRAANASSWLTRKLEVRVSEALGRPLAVILRPAMGELLAVWGGRRGLRGPWCLTADGRPVALGHDDHVAVDPALRG